MERWIEDNMTATETVVHGKPVGDTWIRLTVHLNGPSVQFADPVKTGKDKKRRIMNTLSFSHVKESEVNAIINNVKTQYTNLEKSKNMPDGIKWYLSRMK